jgi:hypothetical protein
MHLALQCAQRLSVDLAIITDNAAAGSIFPLVEVWLQETTDHWNSFEMIVQRKDQELYRCVVDMLFCEAFPNFKALCRAFYDDKGPQLRFILTEKQRAFAEALLLVLLQVAYEFFSRGRELSWRRATRIVEELALAEAV